MLCESSWDALHTLGKFMFLCLLESSGSLRLARMVLDPKMLESQASQTSSLVRVSILFLGVQPA